MKTYLADKKKFEVSNLTYTFTSDMIVVKSMTPTPNATEKTNIEATIKGDLYNSINQQLKSLQGWMNDNAAKQKITDTYESDIYTYRTLDKSFSLPINVQQLLVVPEGNNIVAGYAGSIEGVAADCPVGVPKVLDGYKMFISQDFAQSFAQAIVERYTPYKNVLINGSWVRTTTFQFRLVDLEYVLAGVYDKYAKYYMNPISFACSINSLVNKGYILDEKLVHTVKWLCSGHLWIDSKTSKQIIGTYLLMQTPRL